MIDVVSRARTIQIQPRLQKWPYTTSMDFKKIIKSDQIFCKKLPYYFLMILHVYVYGFELEKWSGESMNMKKTTFNHLETSQTLRNYGLYKVFTIPGMKAQLDLLEWMV